jgi:hypothetical protein
VSSRWIAQTNNACKIVSPFKMAIWSKSVKRDAEWAAKADHNGLEVDKGHSRWTQKEVTSVLQKRTMP